MPINNTSERIPSAPPHIPRLAPDEHRPLWSVMIPVYNCSRFIPDVLSSVLVQALEESEMQIEVVDDGSTDADVEAIVQAVGKGRIKYFKQPKNVGSLRNFETCIKRSKGRLVHLLHGDDRVKPGFYDKITYLFQKFPEIGAAFSNYSFIDEDGETAMDYNLGEVEDGVLKNWLIRIAEFQKIQYASMVVRREVYEKLGSYFGMNYGEDWEMWVRIAKHYPVAYTPELLAEYRGHAGSLTWEKAVDGHLFRDLNQVMQHIQQHVPPKYRAQVSSVSKKHCAHYLIGMAITVWVTTNNLNHSNKLIKQALIFNKGPYPLARIAKFYMNVCLAKLKGKDQTYSTTEISEL